MTGRRATIRQPDSFLPEGFCACPVDIAFSVVGKKWTVHLIRNMLGGQRRFNQFLTNIEGINPKILSVRLKEMERENLVVRRVVSEGHVLVEYELTEKGHDVLPILRQMVRWSVHWAPERVFSSGQVPKDLERMVEEWQAVLVAPMDDDAESPPIAAAKPRPRRRSR